MPSPAVDECERSIARILRAREQIFTAISSVTLLTDGETWSGPASVAWMTEFNNYVVSSDSALDDHLDTAITACRAFAARAGATG